MVMKHLKGYKLFESNQTLLSETIMDICLDLEDEGFYTNVSPESEQRKHIQKVRITLCDDDYISDISSAAFTPVDIKDTLDRIYDVIGKNLLTTAIRLYNTHNSYYEVNMLKSINHQSNYPETKVYGIEIRFFQPGDYGTQIMSNESNLIASKRYKLFESNSNEDIIEDCRSILLDLSDDDVKSKIEYTTPTDATGYRYLFGNQDRLDRIEGVIQLTIGDYTKGRAFDPGYYVEVLEHLNSYLNSNGYYYYSNGTNYSTWEEKIESINRFKGTSSGKLTLMDIYWVKDLG
jgi:hypothetical protein